MFSRNLPLAVSYC